MDGGERFRELLQSVKEQYEEDLHYLRCARRSALHRNCTKNMDDREDPAPVKTANALVQTELVEEPRVQVPDDSVLDDLQEEPKILEVMEVREALREVPEHEGKKLFLPRSSGHTRPSMSGARNSVKVRNSKLRFSSAVVPDRPADAEAYEARSPRSSIRSSLTSSDTEARHGFQCSGRRTMFFDKSPEEVEAMFQEAFNEDEDGEEEDSCNEKSHHRLNLHAGLRQFIETDVFEMIISWLILGNVIVMAAAVQYRGLDIGFAIGYPGKSEKAADLWPGAESVLNVLDTIFTGLFFLELFLRLLVYGLSFFTLALNWLDFMVVIFSLMEVLLAASIPGSSTVLRLVRLAKLARGLRVVRMARVMDSLNLLLKSIGASFSMLMWSMLLIAVIQCTAGMFVGYLVMDFLEKEDTPDDVRRQIYRYYGTFTYTILTMFEVIFANWPIPCRLLVDYVDEWFSLYFIIYRCVVGFCVLNVVGAVFVQQTMKVAADDHDLFMQQQTRNAEAYARKIKDVFAKLDTSGEGVIFMDEFVEILNTPTMSHFMTKLELESTDLLSLFKLIDVDDTGHVSLEDFMAGCQRLKGPAKSVDLALLLAHTARLNCKVDKMMGFGGEAEDSVDWGYGAAGKQLEQRFAKRMSMRNTNSCEWERGDLPQVQQGRTKRWTE
mmetsp:Transcript_33902/g.81275  ORF Transcript_33902/g.81275 Transcript_33902/m.81275 type:complete len:664 (-) Transcript_33902:48-2039(-)